jgi:hypothetical protein
MNYITANRQQQAARLLNQHYAATKENLLGDGLKLCRRAKAHNSHNPDTAYIEVSKKVGRTFANMRDVAHCGNAHLCAHCSSVKAAHMRDWLTEIFLPEIDRRGLSIGLLTLTAHHKRDMDWSVFVANFYLALSEFRTSIKRSLIALGSLGRIRTMESPVGSNGLHIHMHDLFTYKAGADVQAFEAVALKKWKASLKKFGLKCNGHGVNLRKNGEFDARYIAKEIAAEVAAYDTKTESKSDLQTLFQLLDKSRLGDNLASNDWIRAAKAIQGRDKWNVGQLATKLNIPCPSEWRKPKERAVDEEQPHLIEYPQVHHMVATAPTNERAGLAFILRAARSESTHTGSVKRMALRMCEETIKSNEELIKKKYAKKLATEFNKQLTDKEKDKILSIQAARCNFEIEDYKKTMLEYLNYTPTVTAPAPTLTPGLELDFS